MLGDHWYSDALMHSIFISSFYVWSVDITICFCLMPLSYVKANEISKTRFGRKLLVSAARS